MKIQQKSPGLRASPPVLKISGPGLLTRMSHLVSIVGQETRRPEKIRSQKALVRRNAASFQVSVCSSEARIAFRQRKMAVAFPPTSAKICSPALKEHMTTL